MKFLFCITVIKAYTRIGNATKADSLILELEERLNHVSNHHNSGKVSLDIKTLASRIDAWGKASNENQDYALDRADQLLQQIIDQYQSQKQESHVDSWVFTDVIRLWSRSHRPNALDRIQQLIDQMDLLQQKVPGKFLPNTSLFILALDACSVSNKEEAGKTALAI